MATRPLILPPCQTLHPPDPPPPGRSAMPDAPPRPTDRYTHGHHPSVLRSHEWRTAENSAGYLLGRLGPGLDLLDVGCGPGTITADLARRVAPGRVVGVDSAAEVVARAAGGSDAENVSFEVGDAYALPFDDESFDVVHAHQVLQHLSDPVAALVEMRRVLRVGGLVAVRDGDFGGFMWAPSDPVLDRWMELYHQVTAHNGAEADGGRHLLRWVRAAGFVEAVMTSSTWTYADPETRAWWGGLWAERMQYSALAEQAVAFGLSDPDELAEISRAFCRWSEEPDATFVIPHGEVLATKGPPDPGRQG
jgi:ubiquinone/menaquinone biosynthesis C-methylase UbiE